MGCCCSSHHDDDHHGDMIVDLEHHSISHHSVSHHSESYHSDHCSDEEEEEEEEEWLHWGDGQHTHQRLLSSCLTDNNLRYLFILYYSFSLYTYINLHLI